jgi:hypothetical protein
MTASSVRGEQWVWNLRILSPIGDRAIAREMIYTTRPTGIAILTSGNIRKQNAAMKTTFMSI